MNLRRRHFAGAALAGFGASAFIGGRASAQAKTLRFGHLHSVDSPVHKGIAKAAEEIEKGTSGRYKVNIFPSSQLGAAREMVSQVIDGSLDFISEGPGSLSNLDRALSFFEAPFVARDWNHLLKMLDSPFGRQRVGVLADQRNMVLSAPRLTMFNGQRSWISFARRQSYVANVQPVLGNASGAFSPVIAPIYDGFVLDIEAVASADRRYVTMTVEYAQNQFERFDTASVSGAAGGGDFTGRSAQFAATIQLPVVNAQQVQTTVTVPDKGTILLGGERKLTEVEVEVGVPVLSKVPFVNRFFTNTLNSKTETTVLLLIRPEVIVLQEAEDQLFPGLRDEMNQSTQMSGY